MMSASQEDEQRQPLNGDHPPTPNAPRVSSPLATFNVSPSAGSTRHRPGYKRLASVSLANEDGSDKAASVHEDEITPAPQESTDSGLGIAFGGGVKAKPRKVTIQPIARYVSAPENLACADLASQSVPVPKTAAPEQHAPGSADSFITATPSTAGLSGSTRFGDSPELDTAYKGAHLSKQSISSFQSSVQPSVYARSDAGLLSVRSKYDWDPDQTCRSHRPIRRKWMSKTILLLSLFSTIMSAILLIIGLHGPRYGRMIYTDGPLTASSAAFLTSFIAKLTELTFVTVLVACLGQMLARRAYKQESRSGVMLAELSMRSWITQPGTMVTQWHSVRYAGITFLGITSLVGALSAMLYTSAATALVQPQLKWPDWKPQLMQGLVKTSFANTDYIQNNCKTPVQTSYDPEYADTTCIQMEHAALGYHNYFSYLSMWTDVIGNGTNTSTLAERPPGYALLNDNTTITAPWIEIVEVENLYNKYGFIINNVSMAMPHPGE
jgi:hypothetical protein